MPSLVEAGYQVHLYDLLGFGLSERPQDETADTSVTGQVPILEALMDLWGLDSAHVIAHDIGGAVAKRFALHAPERVRTLTLLDIVSYDSWPSERTRQQMQAGLEPLIKAPDETHRAHFREWLLSTVENKDKFKETALDTYLDFIAGPVGQTSLFQHQVMHYDPKHTLEIAPRYAELEERPVQMIWGADDAWQVLDWAHRLHQDIPGSALHVLEDCGHFSIEDQPELISKLLVDFLHKHA